MRFPLDDGQGDCGSMDDDPPAAMRYTEARMAPIAEELLADLEKDTVDFQPNYDDRLEEPSVLPASFPNLLVNGSSGIAVGMSTNIPPHNLGEIIDATIALIEEPSLTVSDLMEYVTGPDFPTGAEIVGREDIHEAYHTGRARLKVRARYEIERRDADRDRIVITEVPYQTNKARLVERIAENVNDGRIEGITDLRDESDRSGVRIVIEVSRDAVTDVVENKLLEHHLEQTYSYISLALIDSEPRVLDLKEALQAYIDHRLEVVRRRSEFDLGEAKDRAHILEGRLHALEHTDAVIETIRDSEDRATARSRLQEEFDFSEAQAEHVVRMQLGSLTSMEVAEVEEEYAEVSEEIEYLESILADEAKLRQVVIDELQEINAEYDDERRTAIVERSERLSNADLIPERDVLVAVTAEDYVKRMDADTFEAQGRGGKGLIGGDVKESDRVTILERVHSHDRLLCFTDAGTVHERTAFELPELGRTARGRSFVNVLDVDDESVTAILPIPEDVEYVTLVTAQGYVKRLDIEAFDNVLQPGIIAADLPEDDRIVDAVASTGTADVLLSTANGMTIRFDETEVRPMGRTARGVGGIDLEGDDRVISAVAVESGTDCDLLTMTERGYGKRTPLSSYRRQSRYGKGLIDIKTGGRNGTVVATAPITDGEDLVIMSERGQILRTPATEISRSGRNTMGVTIMDLESGDAVAGLTTVAHE